MICAKKPHDSIGAAIIFHQSNFDGAYAIYKCMLCSQYHISLNGISERVQNRITNIIQTDNHPKKTFLRRVSDRKTMWQVEHYLGTFRVLYNSKSKNIEIM